MLSHRSTLTSVLVSLFLSLGLSGCADETVARRAPLTGRPDAKPGPVGNAVAVVAAMQPAFRSCYNHALRTDPHMRGSVRITARIGTQGEVLSVSPSGGHGLSPSVLVCLTTVVSHARFAPPEGGGATAVIPVTFVTRD